jgi:hypothetical protein
MESEKLDKEYTRDKNPESGRELPTPDPIQRLFARTLGYREYTHAANPNSTTIQSFSRFKIYMPSQSTPLESVLSR